MKPRNAAVPQRASLAGGVGAAWRERSGRLFVDLERPARMMIRRAFRTAFSDEEIQDIYSAAWVGALRALAGRHEELTDDQIRSYVMTAVANQASKELRRRRRKPAAPLEVVRSVPDQSAGPDEHAARAEDTRLTRDLLTSLPARRRAVILLRYGWGLEPRQVCGLIKGLSPRAYRKEITKGVDELTAKMKAVESGTWCQEREPILKTYAAGLANADQAREAQAHMSHCRSCSEFVARLGGHLHDLGGVIAASGTIDGLDGEISLADRVVAVSDRARDALGVLSDRGASSAADGAATQVASAGGLRGAGAAGAGVLAKLAGLGTAGKVAVACLGGGAAATACIAAGVGPIGLTTDRAADGQAEQRSTQAAHLEGDPRPESLPPPTVEEQPPAATTTAGPRPNQGDAPASSQPAPAPEPAPQPEPAPEPEPEPTTPVEPTAPVEPSAPPVVQEFEVAAAAQPAAESSSASPSPSTSSSAGAAGVAEGSAVRQEFGP